MPGVLTACGQTNAFTHADSLATWSEIQGSDKPIASHHCLHSGIQVRHREGSSDFLVVYEWHSACVKMT
jgi:hypothetical protein